MGHVLVTASFDHLSGLAEDRIVNTFAFTTAGEAVTPTIGSDCTSAVRDFYEDYASGGQSICNYMGLGVSRAANSARLRAYDITGKLGINPATGKLWNHGSPIYEQTFTPEGWPGTPLVLPEEMAVVMTLRAVGWDSQPIERVDGADAGTKPDRPRQRYSGRFFAGPFHNSAVASVSGRCRPTSQLRDTLMDAAQNLQTLAVADGHAWGIWSRSDETVRTITRVEVDDALDTMRSRGVQPTLREVRNVP